jgi:hypothetical protein
VSCQDTYADWRRAAAERAALFRLAKLADAAQAATKPNHTENNPCTYPSICALIPLVSTAPNPAAPSRLPDPPPDRPAACTEAPSRTARLLGVLGKLIIEYGRELANTLRQGVSPDSLPILLQNFGTCDIAVLLAYITRALCRAAALQAWTIERGDWLDRSPSRASAPAHRPPSTARPATPNAGDADPLLAVLPTPEETAAEIRRRPIGATLADIGRDLGILPCDPLWRELASAITENGGNLATLLDDLMKRGFPINGRPPVTAAQLAAAQPAVNPLDSVVAPAVVAPARIVVPAHIVALATVIAPPAAVAPASGIAPPAAVAPATVFAPPAAVAPASGIAPPATVAPATVSAPPASVTPPAIDASAAADPTSADTLPVVDPPTVDPPVMAPCTRVPPRAPSAAASGAGPP